MFKGVTEMKRKMFFGFLVIAIVGIYLWTKWDDSRTSLQNGIQIHLKRWMKRIIKK